MATGRGGGTSPAADLGEDAVEADVDGGVDGVGGVGRLGAARRLDETGRRQVGEGGGAGRLERAELGHGPAVDGDHQPLAGTDLPERGGQVGPQLPGADLHTQKRTHAYTDWLERRGRAGPRTPAMNFAFSEEQEELRRITRQFLESKSPEAEVRRLMDTDEGYDPAVWSQMANELGLQSLIIPEEYGGQGFTFVELTVVLEEMGRALLCAPYFSSCVLAASALLHSGDDAAKKEHLPGIASGETIATLAFTEPNGKWDESGIEATATKDGDGYKLNGTKMFVLDGARMDLDNEKGCRSSAPA